MFEKRCEYCDKVIEGYTEKQVNYLLNQHLLSKHKEFVKLEVKNED